MKQKVRSLVHQVGGEAHFQGATGGVPQVADPTHTERRGQVNETLQCLFSSGELTGILMKQIFFFRLISCEVLSL